MNENFAWIYDRRAIDQEVFKKFQNNGDEIKAAANYKELNKNDEFWKNEKLNR